MNWIKLADNTQLQDLISKTVDDTSLTVLLFKHSTRCSISTMVKRRLDSLVLPDNVVPVYLDLIAYRAISNEIADYFGVVHESPQLLVVKNGKLATTASHTAINEQYVNSAIG
jgi:bacillithiol system protein YtxJ